jgi:hypothetical protein
VLRADDYIERARRGAISDLTTTLAAYWLAERRRPAR